MSTRWSKNQCRSCPPQRSTASFELEPSGYECCGERLRSGDVRSQPDPAISCQVQAPLRNWNSARDFRKPPISALSSRNPGQCLTADNGQLICCLAKG